MKFFQTIQFKILLFTAIALTALQTVRCAGQIINYPQVSIPLEQIYGEDDENLSGLSRSGSRLTAESNHTAITFPFTADVGIKEICFVTDNESRMNCWSYLSLNESGRYGQVIMVDGRNYITFDGADKTDRTKTITYSPVSLRGVSFDLLSMTVNPRGHFIAVALRTLLLYLAAAMLFEIVIFELVKSRRLKTSRWLDTRAVLLGGLQFALSLYFVHQYMISDWLPYTTVYWFALFLSEYLFIILLLWPGIRRTGKPDNGEEHADEHALVVTKKELAPLRILLLAVFDFAMVEILYSDQFKFTNMEAAWQNLVVYALLYLVTYALFFGMKGRRFAWTIPTIFWTVVAGVNHFYFEFRGQAFELSDLTMAATAKNVIGQYRLDFTPELTFVTIAAASVFLAAGSEDRLVFRKKKAPWLILSAALAAASIFYIHTTLPEVNLWNTNLGTKYDGYAVSFLSFARRTLEKPVPEGYSRKEAEAVIEKYENPEETQTGKGKSTATPDGQAPDIIVMMNEAFSDLPSIYGFETNTDGMPYIHSLSGKNVKKGYLHVSVFGGTTADTEYEFLTGNSMAFLHGEAVPYTQYIGDNIQSLARLLKARNYSATAFHPFLASGYKRYKVYPLMGFDKFVSSDDGLPYNSTIRSYMSDDADVDNLIRLYEERDKTKPFFLFNVTMQNHGGYNTEQSAVDVTVNPTDEKLQLPQIQEYLSLIIQSDAAFKKLTDYFAKSDRKAIILMFGDHQPGMNDSAFKAMDPAMYEEGASLEEKEKKYTVPYVMWANYDLPEGELPLTSPNYLRSFLLENAGLSESAYDRMVSTVRKDYPSLNAFGFTDSDGKLHSVSELDSVPELLDYKKAAYYNLFEHGNVNMDLFK